MITPLPLTPVGVAVPVILVALFAIVSCVSVNGPVDVGVNVVSAAIRSEIDCRTRYVNGVAVVWFLLTRFPYDRLGLAAGFLLHVVWLYLLYIRAERRVRRGCLGPAMLLALALAAPVVWLVIPRHFRGEPLPE